MIRKGNSYERSEDSCAVGSRRIDFGIPDFIHGFGGIPIQRRAEGSAQKTAARSALVAVGGGFLASVSPF